ncbi:MAG: hypothetical protein ABIK65_13360 [Candidatus Eisenbacteria bacterium]
MKRRSRWFLVMSLLFLLDGFLTIIVALFPAYVVLLMGLNAMWILGAVHYPIWFTNWGTNPYDLFWQIPLALLLVHSMLLDPRTLGVLILGLALYLGFQPVESIILASTIFGFLLARLCRLRVHLGDVGGIPLILEGLVDVAALGIAGASRVATQVALKSAIRMFGRVPCSESRKTLFEVVDPDFADNETRQTTEPTVSPKLERQDRDQVSGAGDVHRG